MTNNNKKGCLQVSDVHVHDPARIVALCRRVAVLQSPDDARANDALILRAREQASTMSAAETLAALRSVLDYVTARQELGAVRFPARRRADHSVPVQSTPTSITPLQLRSGARAALARCGRHRPQRDAEDDASDPARALSELRCAA